MYAIEKAGQILNTSRLQCNPKTQTTYPFIHFIHGVPRLSVNFYFLVLFTNATDQARHPLNVQYYAIQFYAITQHQYDSQVNTMCFLPSLKRREVLEAYLIG